MKRLNANRRRCTGVLAALTTTATMLAIVLGGCALASTTPRQAMSEAIDPSHGTELVSIEMMGGLGECGLLDAPKESVVGDEIIAALGDEQCTYLRNSSAATWDDGALYTLTVRDKETKADTDELSFTSDGCMYVGSGSASYSLAGGNGLYNLCGELYKEAREMGGEPQ